MIQTLIVKQSLAQIDQSILEKVIAPELNKAKKGEIIQKEGEPFIYYIIPTELRIMENNMGDSTSLRFNQLMHNATARDYTYIMLTIN